MNYQTNCDTQIEHGKHNRRPWKLALLDIDGTLVRGGQAIAGAVEFVSRLRARDIQPVYFTNNSTRSPNEVVAWLTRCGFTLTTEEVCTSSQATAAYLRAKYPVGGRVAYIGSRGLAEALVEAGFDAISVWQDDFSGITCEALAAVVGLDVHISYMKLAEFCHLVMRLGQFVLTNPDVRLPLEDRMMPGNGALGAFVSTATGVHPMVIGKPEAFFIEYALHRYGVSAEETLIIGDNLRTDIAAGHAAGVWTIQVQSGVKTVQHQSKALGIGLGEDMPLQADEMYPSVASLFLGQ